MSAQDNLKLAKKIYESFNNNEIDNLLNYFSDSAVAIHVPTNVTFNGKEGFRQATEIWKGAFSDAKCDIKNTIVSDDYIVTEFNGIGTHDGILETPMGKIGPTGKKINVPFVEILKIKNGKIQGSKLYFDVATMMQQLELTAEKV
jgi:predicted ester cyclase